MTEKHPFRGFFVLFWVSIATKILVTMYQHWKSHGIPISFDLARMMGQDGLELLIADGIMIASLYYTVIFQKLVTWGLVPLFFAGTIQHICQAVWFLGFCIWTVNQRWPWIQSGSFTIHLISMLMKQHSYNSYNIELKHKANRYRSLKARTALEKKKDDTAEPLSSEETQEMTDLDIELRSGSVPFPGNQTILNFTVSMAN